MSTLEDALFGHLCGAQDRQATFCFLSLCRAVCKPWRQAVHKHLPMLHVLDFSGHEARVARTDVLCALAHVAGKNLRTLNLGGCSRLSGADLEEILRCVHVSCCSAQTIVLGSQHLRAAAVGARLHFGCASPRALFEHLKGLQGGAFRWAGLSALLLPRLRLDPGFTIGESGLLDAAKHDSAWDVALLLSVSFVVGDHGLIRTFGCDDADANRRRPVHFVAKRGDEAMMAVLVSARADLEAMDQQGTTPLLAACAAGQLALAQMLIENGADISMKSQQGTTPLLAACAAGQLALAQMLIENGADVFIKDHQGTTPLLMACAAGHLALAQMLIENGADISIQDHQGTTPLQAACAARHLALAQMLIENGADISIKDHQGTTPLQAACAAGQLALAQMLIENGADISIKSQQGTTPLLVACAAGQLALAQMLIENGADISVANMGGNTPMFTACAAGHIKVAKMLIEKGADISAANTAGNTPLMAACAAGHLTLAQMLAGKGADIVSASPHQWAKLLLAAITTGHFELSQKLVEAGACITATDSLGNTLLLVACATGHPAIAQMLVETGSDISAANRQLTTPLLAACAAGYITLAEMLVKAGACIAAADWFGTTPLLACIQLGHLELAEMLVKKGANVETTRRNGAGLLSIAIVSQNEEVVNFAFKVGPRRFEGQGTGNSADDVVQLAQRFLDPRNIASWIRGGASPSGLAGEIGALLSSAAINQPVKDQLDNVRTSIGYHSDVLHALSEWPVAHCVEQLASQEPVWTQRKRRRLSRGHEEP
jgi:ankyrin repeat protein